MSETEQYRASLAKAHRETQALREAIEVVIDAYRKKYTRNATGGIRANAPLYDEVRGLVEALNEQGWGR